MRVLAFPLRIVSGSFATVEQWSPAEASMIAGAVVATVLGERPLAPGAVQIGPAEQDTDAVQKAQVKAIAAASTDFADFQARMAAW